MYRDNSSTNARAEIRSPQTLYRGLYVRIARKLGVDPSYVSRVARGDRRSDEVETALGQALAEINQQLGQGSSTGQHGLARTATSAKRLKALTKQNRSRIREQWLAHSQSDGNLRRVKIADQKRTAPILPVLDETLKVMELSLKGMATASMKAARAARTVAASPGLHGDGFGRRVQPGPALRFRFSPGTLSTDGRPRLDQRSHTIRRSPRSSNSAGIERLSGVGLK